MSVAQCDYFWFFCCRVLTTDVPSDVVVAAGGLNFSLHKVRIRQTLNFDSFFTQPVFLSSLPYYEKLLNLMMLNSVDPAGGM